MFQRKALLLGVCLILIMGLLGSTVTVMAHDNDDENDSGNISAYVVKDGKVIWLLPNEEMRVLTEEEYIEKYQMSAEEEAVIIHDIPPCPVIIDGIQYEAEKIHFFDGQRLGFTVGNDGKLYAFTTEKGMEEFQREQLIIKTEEEVSIGGTTTRAVYSFFYEDWFYGGDFLAVPPGYPQGYISNLGDPYIGMDNMISSLIVDSAASKIRLFDYAQYGGDYFETLGGTNIYALWFYGWNDRASSLIVYD